MSALPKPEKRKRPRTCVGCGEESPKLELMRVIRTPEGDVEYDPTGRANGRGAYVCRRTACVKLARKKKAFSRAFKVQVDDKVYDMLESMCTIKDEDA